MVVYGVLFTPSIVVYCLVSRDAIHATIHHSLSHHTPLSITPYTTLYHTIHHSLSHHTPLSVTRSHQLFGASEPRARLSCDTIHSKIKFMIAARRYTE